MTIALRTDYDAVRIRAAARAAPDSVQACRLLSIAAICEGKSRAEAAALGGMSRQTLRDWVRRFNAEGPDGLVNRKAPGARRRLSAAQLAELAELVGTGPCPQTDGVVRWRRVDLRAELMRAGASANSCTLRSAHKGTAAMPEGHVLSLRMFPFPCVNVS